MRFSQWRNKSFLLFERLPFLLRLSFFWFLLPIHWIWKLVSLFRNFFYDRGIFRSFSVEKPVVCVGNFLCGGTGKTPFLLFLAEELLKRGLKVVLLTRGYRSLLENRGVHLVCEGNGPLYSAKEMGDEAYLMCKRLPLLTCYVGKDRLKAAKLAEKRGDILLLEDGLQYRKLKPTFQILMQPKAFWFTQKYWEHRFFLPLGRLRDFPYRRKKMDLVVGENQKGEKGIIPSYKIEKLLLFPRGEEFFFTEGAKVALFCAISQPKRLIQAIKELKLQVKQSFFLADHESFSEDALFLFAKKCIAQKIEALICTEKDSVKLFLKKKLPLPLVITKLDMKLISGEDKWQLFIEKIVSRTNNCGIKGRESL